MYFPNSRKLSKADLEKERRKFHRKTACHVWEQGFSRRIELCLKNETWCSEGLLFLILYSAATRSAIYCREDLYRFYRNLASGHQFLQLAAARTYFELEYPAKGSSYNGRIGNYCFRKHRFSLDALTCLLIYIFYENREEGEPYSQEVLFEKMHTFLLGHRKESKDFQNFNHFIEVAPFLTGSFVCASLSHTLQNIRLKNLDSFPADTVSFLNKYRDPADAAPTEICQPVESSLSSRMIGSLQSLTLSNHMKLKNELKKILRRDAKHKPRVIQQLNDIVDDPTRYLPPCIDLTVRWLIKKLETSIIPMTAAGYLNEVFDAMFHTFKDADLYEMESEDLKDRLIAVFKYHAGDADKTMRLRSHVSHIYAHGVLEHDLSCNDEILQLIDADAKAGFVRTSCLDYRYFYAVLAAIDDLSVDELEQTQLKLITVLGFRCGLRIGEILKLQFNEIDSGGGWVGYVRANKSGKNKTRYSLRRFLLPTMLSDEEFRLFRDYYRLYKADGKKMNALLFGQGGYDVKFSTKYIAQTIGVIIKRVTRNEDAVFYSLRHSFATAMAAVAEGVPSVAKELTGFKGEKYRSIQSLYSPHPGKRRDAFRLLSSGMGHASFLQTLLTYIHCGDDLIYAKLNPAAYDNDITRSLLKKKFNIRDGRLKKRSPESVQAGLAKRYERLYQAVFNQEGRGKAIKLNLAKKIELPYPVIETAWETIAEGKSIVFVAEDFGVSANWLQASTARLKDILCRRTLRGSFKFHNQTIDESGILPCYAPPRPKATEALALSYALCSKLKEEFRSGRQKEVLDWCEVVLEGFTYSRSTLRITSPGDFLKLTDLIEDLFPRDRWSGHIEIAYGTSWEEAERAKQCERQWSRATKRFWSIERPTMKPIGRKAAAAQGVLTLKVSHEAPDYTLPRARKFGVRALAYAALLTSCILGVSTEGSPLTK